MNQKIKAHLLTLPRWFAVPFFGCALLIGAVLAGGSLSDPNVWLAFLAGTLLMAGGHSFNTLLDWFSGLDAGDEHSMEKDYAGGCGVISGGMLSTREVLLNAIGWYAIALIPVIILAVRVTPAIMIPFVLGMGVTFWYSWGKFNYTHELALAAGPIIGAVIGALSTGTGEWLDAFLVALPVVTIFSFAGLALDEWPDAEANLKKGVKSLAYKVWEFRIDLGAYLMAWFIVAYVLQTFLISIGILSPMTGITFILIPPFIGTIVFLKSNAEYKKVAAIIVLEAAFYPILLLIGELL